VRLHGQAGEAAQHGCPRLSPRLVGPRHQEASQRRMQRIRRFRGVAVVRRLWDRLLTGIICRLLRLSPVWPEEGEAQRKRRWEND